MGQWLWKIGSYQYSTPKLCHRKCSTVLYFFITKLSHLICSALLLWHSLGGVACLQWNNFGHKILLLVMKSSEPWRLANSGTSFIQHQWDWISASYQKFWIQEGVLKEYSRCTNEKAYTQSINSACLNPKDSGTSSSWYNSTVQVGFTVTIGYNCTFLYFHILFFYRKKIMPDTRRCQLLEYWIREVSLYIYFNCFDTFLLPVVL